jgi:hypothetical protein
VIYFPQCIYIIAMASTGSRRSKTLSADDKARHTINRDIQSDSGGVTTTYGAHF